MKLKQLILCACMLGILCSCQLKRENTESQAWTEETGETEIQIGKTWLVDYEEEELSKSTYGEKLWLELLEMPEEEVERYRTESVYETNEWKCVHTNTKFELYWTKYGIGVSYEGFYDDMKNNIMAVCDYQWRNLITKEEELDSCSREEVLAICQPYAEALGIADSDKFYIETYALTLDVLELTLPSWNVPDENFVFYTKEEIQEAREAGKSEDEIMEMIRVNALMKSNDEERVWEKKHEAIVVAYYPLIEGIEMKAVGSINLENYMVYVPYYDKVVYIGTNLPYSKIEVKEEVELISKQEAIDVALLEVGNCTIKDVTYTYVEYDENDLDLLTEKILIPAWRVDYSIGETKHNSIWIQAIDGYKWEY